MYNDIIIKNTLKFTGGDCISHYIASFVGYIPTVDEFIEWIITTNKNEWGDIYEHGNSYNRIIEYSHGNIIRYCDNYERIKYQRVILHNIDSGYSKVSYSISLNRCDKSYSLL